MKLQELLYKVNILKIVGNTNIDIHDIQFDSRKIKHKGLFIAIKGTVSDGHEYIESVINDGALAIVVEKIPLELNKKITYKKTPKKYPKKPFFFSSFNESLHAWRSYQPQP